jgi:hypothetical protein
MSDERDLSNLVVDARIRELLQHEERAPHGRNYAGPVFRWDSATVLTYNS